MEVSRLYLILKIFWGFIVVLIVEYFCCGIYFRLVRESDFVRVDWICALSALALCYWIVRKLIRSALKEGIPIWVVAAFFLFLSALLGCFLRYSLQLANGLLDFSDPETRVIVITDKKISPFGGSIKEGVNPVAHMVYFRDWDNGDESCELLTPSAFYYFIDTGSRLELSVRRGFFHLAWVEDYQVVKPTRTDGTKPHLPNGQSRIEFKEK
jgi:hypothetical protein